MTYVIRSNDTENGAYSLVRNSDGLLIRRPGVQIPLGPLCFLRFFCIQMIFHLIIKNDTAICDIKISSKGLKKRRDPISF